MKAFAKIAGHENRFAWFSYDHPSGCLEDPKQGFSIGPADDTTALAHLPALTEAQAWDVAENAFYAGGYMDVAALVLFHKGFDDMQGYCEFQSYGGMRKDYLDAPEQEQKWMFSGLSKEEITMGATPCTSY